MHFKRGDEIGQRKVGDEACRGSRCIEANSIDRRDQDVVPRAMVQRRVEGNSRRVAGAVGDQCGYLA